MNLQKEFRTLILPVFRGLPFIIVLMTIAFIFASRSLRYAQPIYQASAAIKLDNRDLGLQNFEIFDNGSGNPSFTNNFLTEVELFHSTSLIKRAFEKLNFDASYYRIGALKMTELYNEIPFFLEYQAQDEKAFDHIFYLSYEGDDRFFFSTEKEVQGKAFLPGEKFSDEEIGLTFTVQKNQKLISEKPSTLLPGDKFAFRINSIEGLMRGINDNNLFVKPIDKEIYIVKVYYQHEVPEKAALFANALVDAYIQEDQEIKSRRAANTLSFIDQEIEEVSKKLYYAEGSLSRFRKRNGLINTTQETDAMLRQANELNQEKLSYDIQEVELRNVYDFIVADQSLSGFSPDFRALNDEVMKNTYVTLKNLELERMGLLAKYSLQSVEVITLDKKIEALKQFTTESIEKKLLNISDKREKIYTSLDDLEEVFKDFPDKERKLLKLQREFQLHEQTYKLLVKKRSELGVVQSSTVSFHKVIDYAKPPKSPSSPNKPLLIASALLVALIVGLVVAYIWHFFMARLSDVEEVKEMLKVPVLAAVPRMKKKTIPSEAVLPLFRQLEQQELLQPGSIITVSSTTNGEGKSTIIAALAELLSTYGKKVLLIDMDFTSASPKYVSDTSAAGFSDYLQQKSTWLSTSQAQLFNGVDLLSRGSGERPSVVAISSPSTKIFLDQLRKDYDVLLIDAAPLKQMQFASAILQHGDVNLMVFKKKKTLLRILRNTDGNLATCSVTNNYAVLNGF